MHIVYVHNIYIWILPIYTHDKERIFLTISRRRWHILSTMLQSGWGISTETWWLDDMFPPDKFSSGSETPSKFIYILGMHQPFLRGEGFVTIAYRYLRYCYSFSMVSTVWFRLPHNYMNYMVFDVGDAASHHSIGLLFVRPVLVLNITILFL